MTQIAQNLDHFERSSFEETDFSVGFFGKIEFYIFPKNGPFSRICKKSPLKSLHNVKSVQATFFLRENTKFAFPKCSG